MKPLLRLLQLQLLLLLLVVIVASSTDKNVTTNPNDIHDLRIVGGTPVILNRNEYDWFGYWNVGCGAILVWEDVMVTAAHCNPAIAVNNNETTGTNTTTEVVGGTTVYFDSPFLLAGVARTIVHRVAHFNYNTDDGIYDFMMLQLDEPVDGKQQISLAKSNGSNDPKVGDQLSVVGFGAVAEGAGPSAILNQVTLDFVPHEECQAAYTKMGIGIDSMTEFCTGSPSSPSSTASSTSTSRQQEQEQQKDTCQGDSGGPVLNENGIIVGIISWGVGCARPGLYGVNARISVATDWIQQQICQLSANPPTTCPASITLDTPDNNNGSDSDVSSTVPTTPTTGPSEGPLTYLVVEITYDEHPTETTWSLTKEQTGTIVAQEQGNSSQVGLVRTKNITDLVPGSYLFQIRDSFGDGLCGDEECGSLKIRNAKGQVVFENNGHFFTVLTLNIMVQT